MIKKKILFLALAVFGSSFYSLAVDIQEVVSPLGIKAWLVEDHHAPTLFMSFTFQDAGGLSDPAEKRGLAGVFAEALLEGGAGSLKAKEISRLLAEKESVITAQSTPNSIKVFVQTLAGQKKAVLEILKTFLLHPRFESEALERIKRETIASIKEEDSDPQVIGMRAWLKFSFPQLKTFLKYPTPLTVKNIKRADLKNFLKEKIARDNLKVSVVGDITPESLKTLLDETFGALPKKATRQKVEIFKPQPLEKVKVACINMPQSIVFFGQEGISPKESQIFPAAILQVVLSAPFVSRLWHGVRENEGLAYYANASLVSYPFADLLLGSAGTKNEMVPQVIARIKGEVARLSKEGVSQAELERAKAYLTGSYALQFTNSSSILSLLDFYQEIERPLTYPKERDQKIMAVTLEEVNQLAKSWLSQSKLNFIVVGAPMSLGCAF